MKYFLSIALMLTWITYPLCSSSNDKDHHHSHHTRKHAHKSSSESYDDRSKSAHKTSSGKDHSQHSRKREYKNSSGSDDYRDKRARTSSSGSDDHIDKRANTSSSGYDNTSSSGKDHSHHHSHHKHKHAHKSSSESYDDSYENNFPEFPTHKEMVYKKKDLDDFFYKVSEYGENISSIRDKSKKYSLYNKLTENMFTFMQKNIDKDILCQNIASHLINNHILFKNNLNYYYHYNNLSKKNFDYVTIYDKNFCIIDTDSKLAKSCFIYNDNKKYESLKKFKKSINSYFQNMETIFDSLQTNIVQRLINSIVFPDSINFTVTFALLCPDANNKSSLKLFLKPHNLSFLEDNIGTQYCYDRNKSDKIYSIKKIVVILGYDIDENGNCKLIIETIYPIVTFHNTKNT